MRFRFPLLAWASVASWCGLSLAQQESAVTGIRPPDATPEPIEVTVSAEPRSPTWTQSRSFTGTRFWRLDKGEQEFEAWYTARFKHDGVPGQERHLWQLEYMVSLIKGVQLDVYFNYVKETGDDPHVEGAQIETRIAPWDYGRIFGNPALYLEWHPQTRGPNRGEVRLLFGGQLVPNLRAALNPFYEANLDSASGVKADYKPETEIGVSGAMGYAVLPMVSFGAEARTSAEQQGKPGFSDKHYFSVVKAGPAAWLSFAEHRLHVTAAVLGGLTRDSDAIAATLIVGYRP